MGKKLNNIPRRKQIKRVERLKSAKKWLEQFSGKHMVRAYAKWFGVDLLCAIKELRMLGLEIDPAYEDQVRKSIEAKAKKRRVRKEKLNAENRFPEEQTGNFVFIAGYTSAGFPYGIEDEEMAGEDDHADAGWNDELPF